MLRFFEKLENASISFGQWITAFAGVVFIRFLLETFSSPAAAFPAAPDVATMVHYSLFFFGAFTSCALIIRMFVPDIVRIMKVLIFITPILWLPPLFDLIYTNGGGYTITYLFVGGTGLFKSFLSFGGSSLFGGLTPGIRVELIIIILGVATYVFTKTKNIVKAVFSLILSYLLIFFWMTLPSLLAMASLGFSGVAALSAMQIFNIVTGIFAASHIPINIIPPTEQIGYQYGIGLVFNAGMSNFIYIINSILVGLWVFIWKKDVFKAFLKNIRPGRAIHFMFMVVVGLVAAVATGSHFQNAADIMVVISIMIAFLCAWFFAIGTNDLVDVSIDEVSNPDRPLITGALDANIMRASNLFFLGWSLIGGFIVGYWQFFLVIVFTASYYVYSMPPLRLKQVPIIGTFLIAIASLCASMSGFYLLHEGRFIGDFPRTLLLIILIFFTLCTNIKDIKDIEGDRANGIGTIPVLIGERFGRRAVGLLYALSFILVGLVMQSWILLMISWIFAILGYSAVAVGAYKEWRAFLVYFVYAAIIIVLLWVHII